MSGVCVCCVTCAFLVVWLLCGGWRWQAGRFYFGRRYCCQIALLAEAPLLGLCCTQMDRVHMNNSSGISRRGKRKREQGMGRFPHGTLLV